MFFISIKTSDLLTETGAGLKWEFGVLLTTNAVLALLFNISIRTQEQGLWILIAPCILAIFGFWIFDIESKNFRRVAMRSHNRIETPETDSDRKSHQLLGADFLGDDRPDQGESGALIDTDRNDFAD